MRIISGTHKSILIQPPKGLPVRPTTDRAKESLFNILENLYDIESLTVLDLFSGTGNIAYEFASRGSQKVVAVDVNEKCTGFIKLMQHKLQLKQLQVVRKDAFAFIRQCTDTFDLVFADAPYAHKELMTIPRLVAEKKLLRAGGLLIVEHETILDLSVEPGFEQVREYGQSAFSFFKPVGVSSDTP